MIKVLRDEIGKYHPLSDDDWKIFESLLQPLRLAKDEAFTTCGKVEDRIGFLLHGSMRSFLIVNEKEVNHDLFIKGDFVCELDSFITREPSDATIIAGERCELVTISYRDVKVFYDISEAGESMSRLIFERIHNKKREQEIVLRIAAAADKLNFFRKNHNDLYEKFTKKEIASYLNIAPETFSRLSRK